MKILKEYYEWFLIASGLVLAGLLLWAVTWGVINLGNGLNKNFGNFSSSKGGVSFNLDKAKLLDFKGLQ